MTRREQARLHRLYVQLGDLAKLNRGYEDDANSQGMFLAGNRFAGAAVAYEFASKRVYGIFLDQEEEGDGSEE